ncbi:hypothetical protein NLJ89_g10703 [Agrocybe chaxingu]|uniref:HIT domain-containing protein n=1 Tax=Agrocybe chaxingu TaxID=84603 RepID=A0A9W8JY60_9AGAR|nr:hypothetical protein NLJ89_g10703 [Agrocybe chaxingu]
MSPLSPLLFSTFEVTTQAFYRASLSYAIVNLKPIAPGHVLVVPKRVVPRLTDLDDNELTCLMSSVKRVGSVVEKAYGGDALTIACQDGKAAGQTVPHVHFHIIPRKLQGDRFGDNNDEIYPELERNEAALPVGLQAASKLPATPRTVTTNGTTSHEATPMTVTNSYVDAEPDRPPRTLLEMETEARWLEGFFAQA